MQALSNIYFAGLSKPTNQKTQALVSPNVYYLTASSIVSDATAFDHLAYNRLSLLKTTLLKLILRADFCLTHGVAPWKSFCERVPGGIIVGKVTPAIKHYLNAFKAALRETSKGGSILRRHVPDPLALQPMGRMTVNLDDGSTEYAQKGVEMRPVLGKISGMYLDAPKPGSFKSLGPMVHAVLRQIFSAKNYTETRQPVRPTKQSQLDSVPGVLRRRGLCQP